MRLLGPSRLGNVLIVTGLLLLLYIPASYAWTELQGTMLQAQLRGGLPPAASQSAAGAAPSPSATTRPAATGATAGRTGALGNAAPLVATPRSSGSQAASSLSAPQAATALPSATAEPTATPSPTPLGRPVRLVFPDLRIDTSVTEMGWSPAKPGSQAASEWDVPENTAGWAINSAALGVPGNVVVAAHNNIYGMVFRNISLAWPQTGKPTSNPAVYTSDILNGRVIELYAANGQRFAYEVTAFYRLQDYGLPLSQMEANAEYLQPTPDPELTLVTCWPPWSNTHRLVVRAKLVQ